MQRDLGDAVGLLVSLKPDDSLRWEMPLRKDAFASNYLESWLGDDGSALVHRANNSVSGTQLQQEDQLIHISSSGKERIYRLTIPENLSQFEGMKAEDLQRYYEYRKNSDPESLKKVSASARAGGGFDVLFQRKGGGAERSGFWLRRLDASGAIESEYHLGEHIIEYGLNKWQDFYVDENELVLLSRVLVTQTQVPPGNRAWTQNAVSWIPLDSGVPRVSRVLPLDLRYLEKALNTGDEQRQYLDGFPGTEAFSLENLNGAPLVTGRGWVERKWALRLALATDDLPRFTEAIDKKRQADAKRARSKQKKEDRAANKQAINASMAAAVGMSPEKYAALSKRERAALMISQGDMSSVMAALEQQAKKMQQTAASQQASAAQQVSPGAKSIPGMTPEQQAQLASIPGMSPEQLAQIQGALAQAGVIGAATGVPGSSASAAQSSAAKAAAKGDPLPVDAAGRAFIDYSNPAANMTQLRVFDRKSNKDLLSKQYSDGIVYEYLNFSAFGVPLSQIGVVIEDAEGKTLVEMTPVQG
jgi:hypothetical protein